MICVLFCTMRRNARSLKTSLSSVMVTRVFSPFLQQGSGEMMLRYWAIWAILDNFDGIFTMHVKSLIVRYRCKLELWDDSDGLESGARPDLVIDRSSRTNLGRNKYVDSLADEDEYEHMDEKISAYR